MSGEACIEAERPVAAGRRRHAEKTPGATRQGRTVLAATVVLLHGGAALANSIETSDGRKPAACEASVQSSLKADVVRLAGRRNASDAWLVVRTLLCGRGASTRSVIATHSASSIRHVMDGPNADPPTTLKAGAPELQAASLRGNAWGPMAHDDDDKLAVVAWTNQICWAHFDLEFTGKTWALVEIGAGCD